MSTGRWGAGFSAVGRFVAEIQAASAGKESLKPGYVLAGDEIFLLDRCREAVLKAFVPTDLRDFCLSDLDLSSTPIFDVLDRALFLMFVHEVSLGTVPTESSDRGEALSVRPPAANTRSRSTAAPPSRVG